MPYTSPTRLLTITELAADLRYSVRTIRRLIATQQLPAPRRVADGSYRWLQSDVLLWIELDCPNAAEFVRVKHRRAES